MTLKLVPVVELEPGRFATRAHAPPNCSRLDDAARWETYWRDSLADSDVDLRPVFGTQFVELNAALSHRHAQTIVLRIAGLEDAEHLDDVGAMPGGLVLMENGAPILFPQCYLSMTVEFREVLNDASDTWREIWIGHPMLSLRDCGGLTEFSKLVAPERQRPIEVDFRVRTDELAAALAAAEIELGAAVPIVAALVRDATKLDAEGVARILTGHRP